MHRSVNMTIDVNMHKQRNLRPAWAFCHAYKASWCSCASRGHAVGSTTTQIAKGEPHQACPGNFWRRSSQHPPTTRIDVSSCLLDTTLIGRTPSSILGPAVVLHHHGCCHAPVTATTTAVGIGAGRPCTGTVKLSAAQQIRRLRAWTAACSPPCCVGLGISDLIVMCERTQRTFGLCSSGKAYG